MECLKKFFIRFKIKGGGYVVGGLWGVEGVVFGGGLGGGGGGGGRRGGGGGGEGRARMTT